jgi:putative DNA primase/helicase
MTAADVAIAFPPERRNRQPEPPARTMRSVEVTDFLDLDLPEREMLLDPVLPAQGLAMLFAPRGVGKTHVGLTVAYAVAAGGSIFRWSAPKPTPVLYIDGEMPGRTMQERVAAIVAASTTEPPPGYLRFVLADLHEDGLPDLASDEGQTAIEAALGEAKLLVLDNLSSLVRSGRENEADSWQPVQDFLLRLRRRGVSVLLIHHAAKGGQQRGTSRREDVLDTVINLRRPVDYQPSEGARFEVHIEKARGVAGDAVNPFEAKLEIRDGMATWTTRGLADAELMRVVALTLDGLTVRDIAVETGMSVGKISKLQRRAVDEGLVPDKPRRGGKGGRNFDGGADDE